MSKYITVVIKYEDDTPPPRIPASMEVLGGVVAEMRVGNVFSDELDSATDDGAPSSAAIGGKKTTAELAKDLNMQPSSIRVAYCKHGHYFGLKPTKLPNGRLLWPADSLDRLAEVGF